MLLLCRIVWPSHDFDSFDSIIITLMILMIDDFFINHTGRHFWLRIKFIGCGGDGSNASVLVVILRSHPPTDIFIGARKPNEKETQQQ